MKTIAVSAFLVVILIFSVCASAGDHIRSDGFGGYYTNEGHYRNDGFGGLYTPGGGHQRSDGFGGWYK